MALNPPILAATLPAQILNQNSLELNIPIQNNLSVSADEVYNIIIRIYSLTSNIQKLELIQQHDNTTSLPTLLSLKTQVDQRNFTIGTFYKMRIAYAGQDVNDVDLVFSTEAVFKLTAHGSLSICDRWGGQIDPELNPYQFSVKYEMTDVTEKPFTIQYKIESNDTVLYASDNMPYNSNRIYTIPILILSKYRIVVEITTINKIVENTWTTVYTDFQLKSNYRNKLSYTTIVEQGCISIQTRTTPMAWYRKLQPQDLYYSYMGILIPNTQHKDYFSFYQTNDIFIDVALDQDGEIVNGYLDSEYYQISKLLDLENIYLYDGTRQMHLQYDTTVSTLKQTVQETKIDTIGSTYPLIVRNGHTRYKEFQLSATLSYLTDNNQLFMSNQELFNTTLWQIERENTNDLENIYLPPQTRTNNLTINNILAEYKFREAALNWLNNGNVKLLRSPTEGNMLIRLMNISLTPKEVLGRMIYSFSATAYEVAEINRGNLIKYGLLKVNKNDEDILV